MRGVPGVLRPGQEAGEPRHESAFGPISILHLYLWAVAASTDADIKSIAAKSVSGGFKGQQELVEDFHLQVFKDLIAKHDYI